MLRLKRTTMAWIFIFFAIFPALVNAQEFLFYTLRTDSPKDPQSAAGKSLVTNRASIQGIIAQAFEINEAGIVGGHLNEDMVNFTHQYQIPLFALVTNEGFNQSRIHRFLTDTTAQASAIKSLASICHNYKLTGFQIDFEHVPSTDRYVLNEFAKQLSKSLHENNCQLSFAVFPRTSDFPSENSPYWFAQFQNWSGAYDYWTLGRVSDFVTVMAYDQHTGSTTPGPVAGYIWDEAVIRYALRYILPAKLSLGVPVYGDHWFTSQYHSQIRPIMETLGYPDLIARLKALDVPLAWDNSQQVPFAIFIRHHLNEYVFAENAKSFKAKLDLAQKYHLRGVSVWRLGLEDPNIWQYVSQKDSL